MLRGNYTARIDAKGRLKVPTPFRRLLDEKHGGEYYITSLTGDNVRIYPLPEWESIEQRLSLLPTMDPARRKFLDRTNYYGQQATIDGQGRLLIHPLLRKAAGVPFGLPAMRWMLEIGAAFLRTETELILKSRRVVPGRLLESGFHFDFPMWSEAATDLINRWRASA